MSAFPLTLYNKMLFKLHGNRFMGKEFHISTYLNSQIYSSRNICAMRHFASSFLQIVMTCNSTSCKGNDCNICSKLCNARIRIKL